MAANIPCAMLPFTHFTAIEWLNQNQNLQWTSFPNLIQTFLFQSFYWRLCVNLRYTDLSIQSLDFVFPLSSSRALATDNKPMSRNLTSATLHNRLKRLFGVRIATPIFVETFWVAWTRSKAENRKILVRSDVLQGTHVTNSI